MAGSIQVSVRKGVIADLAALPSLADVRVSYAYEFGQTFRERIFTTRARAAMPPASLKSGRNFRNEQAYFDIVILVEGVGLAADETDDRLAVISTIVEEYLADTKSGESLGIAGLNWIREDSWEAANLGNDRGSLSEKTITVLYDARIT